VAPLPSFPYGAVYFRKSNPPPEDWERDYRTAAEDGLNAFRHWFLWSAIEVAPGEHDWADYDHQLDLAALLACSARCTGRRRMNQLGMPSTSCSPITSNPNRS
jgi:hypothetical protein